MDVLLQLAATDGQVEMDFLYAGNLKLAVHQCCPGLEAHWKLTTFFMHPLNAEKLLIDLHNHIRISRRMDACRLFYVEREAECQED